MKTAAIGVLFLLVLALASSTTKDVKKEKRVEFQSIAPTQQVEVSSELSEQPLNYPTNGWIPAE